MVNKKCDNCVSFGKSFFKKNIASPKNNHFLSIQNYKYEEKAPKNIQKQLV